MNKAAFLRLILAGTVLALGACSGSGEEKTTEPAVQTAIADDPEPSPPAAQIDSRFGQAPPADTVATAFGRGTYAPIDGKPMNYTFDVNFLKEGAVSGALVFSMFDGAKKFDVTANVICGHYDADTRRVWVGGEIEANRSTLEAYQTERFGTGQPIWFRFQESETHPQPAAKMSAPKFSGDDKLETAKDFCDAKGWLAGDAGVYAITAESAVIVFVLPEGM